MEKKILIACAMQQDEIEKYRKQLNITYPVVYLQRGLHRNPSVLRNLLQQEIDRHQDVDIILLTYGLCGRGTEGIVSWNTELVMPRFHDCIHQLLENHVDKNSLYATRAWTIDKESIGGQCSTVLAAYGRERGMEVLDTIYGGYEKITLIDTQSYDIKKTKDGLKRPAELLNKKLAVEPSACNIIRKLLSGKWDCNFVHLEKGERVTERHFI